MPNTVSLDTAASSQFKAATDFNPLLAAAASGNDNQLATLNVDPGNLPPEILNTALGLVKAMQPASSNFFNWMGDKSKLKDVKYSIKVVSSNHPLIRYMEQRGILGPTADAFTAGAPNEVTVYLVSDRLLYPDGQKRQDVMAYLTTVLAHEIFGNVQWYSEQFSMLPQKPKPIPTKDPVKGLNQMIDLGNWVTKYTEAMAKIPEKAIKDRKNLESNAFLAGINFLQRFMNSSQFKQLSPKLQDDFKTALAGEKDRYDSWQKLDKFN